MTTWFEANKALKERLHAGDLDGAQALLDGVWQLARGEPLDECNTHFTEGMLRDAQRRYDEALAAFEAALKLDVRLRGEHHPGVADTLHSIAIVQWHRGQHEASLEAQRREAAVVEKSQRFRLAATLTDLGSRLVQLKRLEEAEAVLQDALKAAASEKLTPAHDVATAFVVLSETLRQRKEFHRALSMATAATQQARPKMSAQLADAVGKAWFTIGVLSQHAFQTSRAQAALAYWFSSEMGDGAVRERARAALETLPERIVCRGDPNVFRILWSDEKQGIAHVGRADRGLFIHRKAVPGVKPGDVVQVSFKDGRLDEVTAAV